MSTKRCSFLLGISIAFWSTRSMAVSISDYCRFGESLKQKFRALDFGLDLDKSAAKARRLAQENLSGSWGAVIVVNKDLALEERVDWHLHTVNPQPSRCRLLINDTVVVEVFRTGYRKMNVNQEQRRWSWSQTDGSLEVCPHSMVREVMATYSLKHSGMSDSNSEASSRHSPSTMVYATAKNLAQLFYAETGHHWNVFITKNANQNDLGLNLPLYVFDARPGFCIGQTPDGYNVNAAVVGFTDEHEETTSNG